MSNYTKVFIAIVVSLLMASPALADYKLNGYFRTQMITQNTGNTIQKDSKSNSMVDNRLRMKFQDNLNEYVHFVYYAEIDTDWGLASKGDIGGGGRAGADGVNVETKNVYLDVKIPNTALSTRIGVQTFHDNEGGIVLYDDQAGIRGDFSLAGTNVTLAYFKKDEGSLSAWDDNDFYAVQLSQKYGDFAKAGLDFYDNNDQTDAVQANAWWAGVHGDYKFGVFGLQGFFLYNHHNATAAGDQSGNAWAATVKGNMLIPNGHMGLRLIYMNADDSDNHDNTFAFFQRGQGGFEFYDENSQIFLSDIYYTDGAGGRHALNDAAYAGYGMYGIAYSGQYTVPNAPVSGLYLKWGAGYYAAAKKDPKGLVAHDGTSLGFELDGQVGMKVAEKVDLSLRGAYGFLGNFYKNAAGQSPDDLYTAVLMVNVPY